MKNIKKYAAIVACITMLLSTSVITSQGVTLYQDGAYTYADTGTDTVALYNWDGNGELSVPNSFQSKYVTSVYNYAFMGNQQITSVNFSQNYILNTVGIKAFCDCSALEGEVILPTTIQSLSLGAFQECPNLQSFSVNGSVTVIPEQCCYKDYRLKQVNLPTNLESIEKLAFAECYSLQHIYIPETVSFIHPTAFDDSRNVVLDCKYDSYAYHYAKDNAVKYYLLGNALLGDANGDGYVNVNDVTAIQRHAAELELLEGINFHAADINGDGNVSVDDATELQRFLAEYIVDYPIGEVMAQ